MNRHVVITGASSGIGEALAREFAQSGASLTLVARRRPLLQKLAASLPGTRTHVVEADLSVLEGCTSWLDGAEAALGPVDVLINNAGVQVVGPTASMDLSECDALMRVDLLAPLHLCHAVLNRMLPRNAGTLVNLSSVAGLAPTPGMTWYNAAKAGLGAASESLRGELLKTGVHVVTVYPGPVDTPMAQAAYAATAPLVKRLTPMGTPAELARLIRDAVDNHHARVIYPAVYATTRHMPAVARAVLDAFTPPFENTSKTR